VMLRFLQSAEQPVCVMGKRHGLGAQVLQGFHRVSRTLQVLCMRPGIVFVASKVNLTSSQIVKGYLHSQEVFSEISGKDIKTLPSALDCFFLYECNLWDFNGFFGDVHHTEIVYVMITDRRDLNVCKFKSQKYSPKLPSLPLLFERIFLLHLCHRASVGNRSRKDGDQRCNEWLPVLKNKIFGVYRKRSRNDGSENQQRNAQQSIFLVQRHVPRKITSGEYQYV